MFFSLILTGCEEDLPEEIEDFLDPTPNYITVTVSARARAIYQSTDSNGIVATSPNNGVQVQIKIQKAGGEHAVWDKVTDSNGYTGTVTASFDVYKEQPVEVSARPQGFAANRYGYKVFTWNDIWHLAGEKFGQSITVSAHDLVVITEFS